ncbi:TetR family transcriptional regulator [Mycolicibacterium poriferae]|uniref:TetR family transcriptional regulator n=1 Tax=Mycolicibacterium poriferae TaxID=39694 RepID=UPI0024B8B780|nr:TetR family transcriptional regulator [Mycolicibacterium poriferae]
MVRTLPATPREHLFSHGGALIEDACTTPVAANVDRPGPSAQSARRSRVVSAAAQEAAVHGYQGLNMRNVAEAAGVSTATIYRYFPSKPHLVVAVLGQWLEDFDTAHTAELFVVASPHKRLQQLMRTLFAELYRQPLFADAVALAYALADESAAGEVESVRLHVSEIFAEALGHEDFTPDDVAVGALLCDVWLAGMVAMSQRRITAADFQRRLNTAFRLVTARTGSRMLGR